VHQPEAEENPRPTVTLTADRVTVERGGRVVIHDLSFAVARGELLVLTGPNGAGKTTLIRALAGLLPTVSGTVTFAGGDAEATLAEQSHYVGHANAVKASMTAAENLTCWAGLLGGAPARVDDALEALALGGLASIPAGYLSAGQKRRLGLARLLVADRPVWLLDEPTVSLDTASVGLLARVVRAHVAGGGLAIAATHIPLGVEGARELRLGPQAFAA